MAKVKMVLSWWIPMVLITVALMVPTIAGAAGSIKIWPDQLKPQEPSSGYSQTFLEVCNGVFNTPLTPPVGARITKITYYHRGYSGAFTALYIYRVKMGDVTEDVAMQVSDDSTGEIIPVDVPISVDPPGDPIIRPGYRYYIHAELLNDSSCILGVKISYKE
jgi:hypothetical protein